NNNALPLDDKNTPISAKINKKPSEVVEEIYSAYEKQYLGDYIGSKIKRETEQPPIVSSDQSSNGAKKLFEKNKIETLYLWFLFMNRPKMAKFLCSICRNQTVAALLAVIIYSKAAQKDMKNRDTLIQTADEFDEHSKDIIDECFVEENSLAINIINDKAEAFYNCIPLKTATRANCKVFLASDTVQKYADDTWYHHFDDQRHLWKMNISSFLILLASLFLPLLPIASVFYPRLYKEDSAKSKKTNKSIQQCLMVSSGRISANEIAAERSSSNNVMLRIKYFYEAPVVRFYYYVISFFGFLILFSYVLLVDYFPLNQNVSLAMRSTR
ncbi:unnamed protein product, partial [Rotaria sordida]